MKHIFLILTTGWCFAAFSQNTEQIEQDLLQRLQRINFWSEYTGSSVTDINYSDSLIDANEMFEKKLLFYLDSEPLTLKHAFDKLQEVHLTVKTAADGKFRIYSWDKGTGGTMHFFGNVYQYESGGKVFSKSFSDKSREGQAESWFTEIFTLDANGTKAYLAVYNQINSSKDISQGVKSYSIENGKLNDTLKLIKTQTGIHNTLGFEFDFSSVADHEERPVKLIYYDNATRKLKIPVVTPKGKVTSKFITYTFTGKYFERR